MTLCCQVSPSCRSRWNFTQLWQKDQAFAAVSFYYYFAAGILTALPLLLRTPNNSSTLVSYALFPQWKRTNLHLKLFFTRNYTTQHVRSGFLLLLFCFGWGSLFLIAILHLRIYHSNAVWEKKKEKNKKQKKKLPRFRSRSLWEWLYVIFWHRENHHLRTYSQGPDLAPPKFPNMHFNIYATHRIGENIQSNELTQSVSIDKTGVLRIRNWMEIKTMMIERKKRKKSLLDGSRKQQPITEKFPSWKRGRESRFLKSNTPHDGDDDEQEGARTGSFFIQFFAERRSHGARVTSFGRFLQVRNRRTRVRWTTKSASIFFQPNKHSLILKKRSAAAAYGCVQEKCK